MSTIESRFIALICWLLLKEKTCWQECIEYYWLWIFKTLDYNMKNFIYPHENRNSISLTLSYTNSLPRSFTLSISPSCAFSLCNLSKGNLSPARPLVLHTASLLRLSWYNWPTVDARNLRETSQLSAVRIPRRTRRKTDKTIQEEIGGGYTDPNAKTWLSENLTNSR